MLVEVDDSMGFFKGQSTLIGYGARGASRNRQSSCRQWWILEKEEDGRRQCQGGQRPRSGQRWTRLARDVVKADTKTEKWVATNIRMADCARSNNAPKKEGSACAMPAAQDDRKFSEYLAVLENAEAAGMAMSRNERDNVLWHLAKTKQRVKEGLINVYLNADVVEVALDSVGCQA